jgi:hypothetical protein
MGRQMLRRLARFKRRVVSSEKLQGVLRQAPKGLRVARDIALLVLATLAIFIAYRDYLKTDVRLAITSPATGSVVLNKEISIEGTVSGGPYDGYVVHHKAPGDEERQEVRAVQEDGEQMGTPIFPISLLLTDEDGEPKIGRHTVTVTLKSGGRTVQQDSVAFDVIDCSLIVPWEFTLDKPIHDPIDLRLDEQIPGYEFLYYVDGTQWTLDWLDPMYLEDGCHELCIAAVVRGSEEAVDSLTMSIIVDNTPPSIDSVGLSDGARVSGRSTLIATILDSHLASLELCVDNVLIDELTAEPSETELRGCEWGYTLEGGWQAGAGAQLPAPSAGEDEERLEDGWHDVLINACDVNHLCSTSSVRVWVDNTFPELQWDLETGMAVPVLATAGFWLGAKTPDPEASIRYSVKPGPPSTVVGGEFLDTSQCSSGTESEVLATASDLAGNTETRAVIFVVERSPQAWLNTALRAVSHAISIATAPITDLYGQLMSEGLSFGIGAEVPSSLADESRLMWRGVLDLVFVEICPVIGRGFNENTTVGVGFRVPLGSPGLGGNEFPTSLIRPVFEFGTAVTPNWKVLDSLDFGTEKIAETWVKVAFETVLAFPLSTERNAELKLDVGPGCKLSYVEEFVREAVYLDGVIVGVRRFTRDSVKLDVTMDISIAFSASGQR